MDIQNKINSFLNEATDKWPFISDKWGKYEQLLKKHDWTYMYSSGSSYNRGAKQKQEIEKLKNDLTKEDSDLANFLYLDYAVKGGVPLTKEAEREYKGLAKKLGKKATQIKKPKDLPDNSDAMRPEKGKTWNYPKEVNWRDILKDIKL